MMGNNSTWLAQAGGAVLSYGNNDIAGNFDGDPAAHDRPEIGAAKR